MDTKGREGNGMDWEIEIDTYTLLWASLVTQTVKNLPAMHESQVQSLVRDDPLKKEMTHHTSILACRIPWTEEPGRLQFMGSQKNWT